MKAKNNAKSGKTFTRVVFLMALNDENYYEPMAVFPDMYWDEAQTCWVSYQHEGQHGACCKAFALLDCIAPRARDKRGVERLKAELENLDEPYALTVLDSTQWLKENADLARQYEKNAKHYELQEEGCSRTTQPPEQIEQMTFDNLLDDGFDKIKQEIAAMFDEEFADITKDMDKDYSDIPDELVYPPMVVGATLADELKARAA